MPKPAPTVETIATSCIASHLRLPDRVVTHLYDAAGPVVINHPGLDNQRAAILRFSTPDED